MSDGHLTDFERGGRITASVVPAILRLDTRSRKWAWRVITGREPYTDSADMRRGREHEPDAIAMFEVKSGLLCDSGCFVPHPTIEWLGASPDGIASELGTPPVEAKCPRVLHSAVPPAYDAQLQVQIQCMQAPYGYFASWTRNGFWWTKVERNDDWWTSFALPELRAFYANYVEPDIEPPRAERRKK